jgi:hypothetical protein
MQVLRGRYIPSEQLNTHIQKKKRKKKEKKEKKKRRSMELVLNLEMNSKTRSSVSKVPYFYVN